jgi:hypothetical protein
MQQPDLPPDEGYDPDPPETPPLTSEFHPKGNRLWPAVALCDPVGVENILLSPVPGCAARPGANGFNPFGIRNYCSVGCCAQITYAKKLRSFACGREFLTRPGAYIRRYPEGITAISRRSSAANTAGYQHPRPPDSLPTPEGSKRSVDALC